MKVVYECQICDKKLSKKTVKMISLYNKPYTDTNAHWHFDLCKDCYDSVENFITNIKELKREILK